MGHVIDRRHHYIFPLIILECFIPIKPSVLWKLHVCFHVFRLGSLENILMSPTPDPLIAIKKLMYHHVGKVFFDDSPAPKNWLLGKQTFCMITLFFIILGI